MRLSSIAKLLYGQLQASEFSAELAGDLLAHTRALATKGTSAPVTVTEDADVALDAQGLAVLCLLFASGQLTASELAYTADALQLADRVTFSDPSVVDGLAECTDPEINGPLSIDRALEIASNGAAA